MISLPLYEVSIALGARTQKVLDGTLHVFGVTQNSKEVTAGTLFVALYGNRVDGHDFIQEAQHRGAVAAVVERYVPNVDIPQLLVPSTVESLGTIAKIWRGRLAIPLIAITGSVGKTTTKELVFEVLQNSFLTHKSRKNFNNELGVPIELLRLERSHQCSVVEFGMRNLNQINYLSKIARPNIAVITNIGMSHIENLKSRENIAKAKAEIFEGMDTESTVILNRDDDFYENIKQKAKGKVISIGKDSNSDIHIGDVVLNAKANPSFTLSGEAINMRQAVGRHHAYNAAIAYAIAIELKINPQDILAKIERFKTPERRGVMSLAYNGAKLLDNSYSAAPDAIKASLDTISHLNKMGNRTVVVIGEMLELGSFSKEAHEHIGRIIADIQGIDILVTIGEYSKYIALESKITNQTHFNDSQGVSDFLLKEIKPTDIIMLQGSNRISLQTIVNELEKGETNCNNTKIKTYGD